MIRMINDLLSLSRMDLGKVELDLELVNLNELFNYILNRFDMMLEKDNNDTREVTKSYTIKRDFTDKPLWVEVDTDKIIQVVDNIMNNAIKYSPDGGVITCRLLETHNHVIMSISDQGLGMPKKELSHIFERFYRVDKARSRAQGGTGLGLAISKEVIELHHGRIWVDSTEGKGSTFISRHHMKNTRKEIYGMKNKRLNGWFLHAILILAVLFSVVFTALIWVTPVYFQRLAGMAAPDKTKVVNEDTNTTDKKKLTDVYRPVSITVTDKRSSSRLLSNRIDVVNLMMTSLEGSKITDISKPETVSKSEYLKLVQTPRSYQLNYGSELSFGVLKQYLAEQPAKSENYSFDRIVISYDGSTVYFLEDAGLKVYKAKLTKYAKAKLNNVHKTKDSSAINLAMNIKTAV